MATLELLTFGRAINIIIEKVFSENETVHDFNKDQFKCLLTLATKEAYFIFDGGLYEQVDGVAMEFPLSPNLANIFFCHYEHIWLCNCSLEYKPNYYKCYVDSILFFLIQKAKLSRSKILQTLVILKENYIRKRTEQVFELFRYCSYQKKTMFLPPQFTVNPLLVVFTRILIFACH